MSRKIRYGMVGGGRGAFIGGVHRIAANIDGQVELVCGAFSSDPEKAKASGADLYLPPERCYGAYAEMIEREKALPPAECMDFIAILTPNRVPFARAQMAQAKELGRPVKSSGFLDGPTTNFPDDFLIMEAHALAAAGKLGKIRKVVAERADSWPSSPPEHWGQERAARRIGRVRSRASGGAGDIGTHAENLSEYVTGSKIAKLGGRLPGKDLRTDKPFSVDMAEVGQKGGVHCRSAARGGSCPPASSTSRRASDLRPRRTGGSVVQEGLAHLPKTMALPANPPRKIIRMFGSYAREDAAEMERMREMVGLAERELVAKGTSIELGFWADDELRVGDKWKPSILQELKRADIIVELLSFNFLCSKFIRDEEHPRALERVRDGKARLFAVVLEKCPWMRAGFGLEPFQVAPKGRPITNYRHNSDAWDDVYSLLMAVLEQVGSRK